MTHYSVNASIRAKTGAEIHHRTPLWSGDATDAKHAIAQAVAVLKPLVERTALADTIVIHAIGPNGVRTTTTEYAEDFTVAPGASLDQSSLHDGADHGLSRQQLEHAKARLKDAAVAAMPRVAEALADKADAVKDFFGAMPAKTPSSGNRVRPATAADMKTFGMEGSDPRDYEVVTVAHADGSVLERRPQPARSLRRGHAERGHAEPDHAANVGGHHSPGVQALVRPRIDPADIENEIRRAVRDVERASGSKPERVMVSQHIFDALSRGGQRLRLFADGVEVEVSTDPQAGQVSIVQQPRMNWIMDESAGITYEALKRFMGLNPQESEKYNRYYMAKWPTLQDEFESIHGKPDRQFYVTPKYFYQGLKNNILP